MKKLMLSLLIIFTINSYAQQQETPSRLFNQTEIQDMVKLALENSNVQIKLQELESSGYRYEPENSTGGIRESDGASFVNIAFNKGDNTLTTQILFAKRGSEEYVTFIEGTIRSSDGMLENLVAYDIINNGQSGTDRVIAIESVLGCIGSYCAGGAVTCVLSNCGWLKCTTAICAGAAVGCVLCSWFC